MQVPPYHDADRRQQLQAGRPSSAPRRCPCPMSTPSRRAVTSTRPLKVFAAGSRTDPGSSSMAVNRPSVAVEPFELTQHRVAHPLERLRVTIAGESARAADTGTSVHQHRCGRPVHGVNHRDADGARALPRVNPARSVASGLTVNRTAGPLVVFSMPSSTSTIGVFPPIFTLPSASATCSAHVLSRSRDPDEIQLHDDWLGRAP